MCVTFFSALHISEFISDKPHNSKTKTIRPSPSPPPSPHHLPPPPYPLVRGNIALLAYLERYYNKWFRYGVTTVKLALPAPHYLAKFGEVTILHRHPTLTITSLQLPAYRDPSARHPFSPVRRKFACRRIRHSGLTRTLHETRCRETLACELDQQTRCQAASYN